MFKGYNSCKLNTEGIGYDTLKIKFIFLNLKIYINTILRQMSVTCLDGLVIIVWVEWNWCRNFS